MSDDKNKDPKNTPPSDGTGSPPSGGTGGDPEKTPSMGFGELMGHIDSRIETAVRNVLGRGGDAKSGADATNPDAPESVAQQVRNELAKLNGEEAAKQKEADRDVKLSELEASITKVAEERPIQQVSKLTQIMWGKRGKKTT